MNVRVFEMMMRMCYNRGCVLVCAVLLVAGFLRADQGCQDFEVEQPRRLGGRVLNAADFGVAETNLDNAAALNAALREAKRVRASRLDVPKGTYYCHGMTGIVIDGLEDFVLDCHGALFVFWRKSKNDWDAARHMPGATGPEGDGENFLIENCRRIRIENVKTDWDWAKSPLAFFGTCVNVHVDKEDNRSYVDFEIPDMDRHPFYPNPVPVQLIQPMSQDRTNARLEGGGARCYCGTVPGHFGCKNEWISPTRLRVYVYVKQPDRPQRKSMDWRFTPKSNRNACGCFDVGGVYNINHHYYGMAGVTMRSNTHLTLRNFHIWSCRGHGLGIEGRQKFTWLDNFRIAPPDPEEVKSYGVGGAYLRSVTSTADGMHVSRSLGYVKMTGCEWAMHNDDSVNFHDCTSIGRTISSNSVRIVNNNGVGYLAAQEGDEIELRQEDYGQIGWRGKIVSIRHRDITFDRPLPVQRGLFFVLFNRAYSTDNLLFRNCLFHNTPWTRNLILGSNVTFDRCRFENMTGSPLRFQTCYTYNVWCEGTGCTNVLVRGCTFRNCSAAYKVGDVSSLIFTGVFVPTSRGWPSQESSPIADDQLRREVEARVAKGSSADVVPSGDIISRITVENNLIVNPRSYIWYATGGSELAFRNNRIVFDGKAPYEIQPEAGKMRVESGAVIREHGNIVQGRKGRGGK